MKKILLFILMAVFIVGCQQAVKESAIKKVGSPQVETPKAESTGEVVVDAVGNDLNNVNNVEKDLNTDELSELDSGLADIQNI